MIVPARAPVYPKAGHYDPTCFLLWSGFGLKEIHGIEQKKGTTGWAMPLNERALSHLSFGESFGGVTEALVPSKRKIWTKSMYFLPALNRS